jgi:hypothetical protein
VQIAKLIGAHPEIAVDSLVDLAAFRAPAEMAIVHRQSGRAD